MKFFKCLFHHYKKHLTPYFHLNLYMFKTHNPHITQVNNNSLFLQTQRQTTQKAFYKTLLI